MSEAPQTVPGTLFEYEPLSSALKQKFPSGCIGNMPGASYFALSFFCHPCVYLYALCIFFLPSSFPNKSCLTNPGQGHSTEILFPLLNCIFRRCLLAQVVPAKPRSDTDAQPAHPEFLSIRETTEPEGIDQGGTKLETFPNPSC